MSARFVHTHLHSEFSLVDSTIRIKALIAACVKAGTHPTWLPAANRMPSMAWAMAR